MNFVKLVCSAALLVSLSAKAEDKKSAKPARKVASKVSCVELNTPFDGNDLTQYSLEEVEALRNSIFAQYGYKFTNASIAAEMKSRGCYKEAVYNYKNLTEVDKQNVRMFKGQEEALKSEEATFEKSWSKANAKQRKELLSYKYCHLVKDEETFVGTIHFSNLKKDKNFELSGLFNLKGLKYEDQEGKTHKLDSTALRSLDSTSLQSIEYPVKGIWTINDKGDVSVSIAGATKGSEFKKITIDSTRYETSGVLGCQLAK